MTLLCAESYLEDLELGIVEVDRQCHRIVKKRHVLAAEVHDLEHQELMLVAKLARLSEKATETLEQIGWLECKVRPKCAAHNCAPQPSSSYDN